MEVAPVEAAGPSCIPTSSTSFDYFTERYFHQYRLVHCRGVVGNNCRLLQHSNGLMVLCLDPSHIAVREASTNPITAVSFGSEKNSARISPDAIKVVGKKKKNALICQKDTKLCTITMKDGTSYIIAAALNGFILELNAALVQQPTLLSDAPTTEGFIAIINPSAKNNLGEFERVWSASGGDPVMDED